MFLPEGEILLITGGGEEKSCIIVSIPEYEYAFLMDAVNFETVMAAASYLRSRGHKKINTLVSSSVKSRDTGALKYIFNTLKVDCLIMPESSRHAAAAENLRKRIVAENGVNRTFEKEEDHFLSFYFNGKKKVPEEILIECFSFQLYIKSEPDRIRLFRKRKDGRNELFASVPRLNTMEKNVYIYPLQ